jgi:rhodanese-related sulfurtransferase
MSFLKYIMAGFLFISSFTLQAASDVISPAEASSLYAEKKAVIVDVRENDEWKVEHIAGAVHIPLDQLKDRLPELQAYKDTMVIAQCRGGKRSLKAMEVLKSAGFSKVYSMDGGLQSWTEQGFAVTK